MHSDCTTSLVVSSAGIFPQAPMIDDDDDFKEGAARRPNQRGVARKKGAVKTSGTVTAKSKRKRKQILKDSGELVLVLTRTGGELWAMVILCRFGR